MLVLLVRKSVNSEIFQFSGRFLYLAGVTNIWDKTKALTECQGF